MKNDDLTKLLALLQEAYAEAGLKLETATLVDDVGDDGTVEGEVLVDNRTERELN